MLVQSECLATQEIRFVSAGEGRSGWETEFVGEVGCTEEFPEMCNVLPVCGDFVEEKRDLRRQTNFLDDP